MKLLKRAKEIQAELAKVKPLYLELDMIIEELLEQGFEEKRTRNEIYVLVDNFSEKMTAYKTVAFPRYSLKITPLVKKT